MLNNLSYQEPDMRKKGTFSCILKVVLSGAILISFVVIVWCTLGEHEDMNKFVTLLALTSASSAQGARPLAPSKLSLHVYIESQCPYSKEFMKEQLAPAYANLSAYFDVNVTSFGNAQYTGPRADGGFNFECQHGPKECQGNMMFACALNEAKTHHTYLKFVMCAMSQSRPPHAFKTCSHLLTKEEQKGLSSCTGSVKAEQLLVEWAKNQHSLTPRASYVPWIIVDGKHSEELHNKAQGHLQSLICSRIEGTKPDQCGAKGGTEGAIVAQ